jgi:N-acetylglutamate synthase-like GNAT family acetyltransferase
MTQYATVTDFDNIAAFDRCIKHDVLRRAIEERCVMIFKTADVVMGAVRWGYFWDSIPFLNLLYVPDGYQNNGVGSALLKYWESEMKAQGYDRVFTSTMAKERGQHFFRKRGYIDIGNLYDEDYGLELIMEKRL